jgi:winged helix DNA-binding protein
MLFRGSVPRRGGAKFNTIRAMADVLTRDALSRATLARQMLLAREKATVVSAVERLAGLQAQLARPPFIGLWSRIEGFRAEDLARAVHDRKVVRATLMRGTLHLMTTRDYLDLRPALQPMLSEGMEGVLKDRAQRIDLDGVTATARACLDEQPRTFEELRGVLGKAWPGLDVRALGYAVRTHLPLVQVPTETRWAWPGAASFAVAESWIGRKMGKGGGAIALVLRYLGAFGPASVRDAQTWSGMRSLADAFAALRPKLKVFHDEKGRELFDLPKAPRPPAGTPAPVRFLPDYDNLLLAHADRTRVVADAHRTRLATKNLQVLATFLVDGFVAGSWKIERTRSSAALVLTAFEPLSRKAKADLTAEGKALLRFAESDAKTAEVRFS